MDVTASVVIDNGSSVCKAGIASSCSPALLVRTETGRQPTENDITSPFKPTTICKRTNAIYVGEDLKGKSCHMIRTCPVSRGTVVDWDHMDAVWGYLYDSLGLQPENQPAIITEAPLSPRSNRQLSAQIFFESFQVPYFHVSIDTPLALHGVGRTSGVVLSCGGGVSSVASVYDGQTLPRSVMRQDYAGKDVDQYLGQLLAEGGNNLSGTGSGVNILRKIKEKLAYVMEHPEFGPNGDRHESTYILPDGAKLVVDEERYMCTECLFQPAITGCELRGVHALLHDSIQQADIDCRREMYRNIVLTGGTASLKGFGDRIRSELERMAPDGVNLNVVTPSNTRTAVWSGAASMVSMSTFNGQWVSRQAYEEQGYRAIEQKCWSCT